MLSPRRQNQRSEAMTLIEILIVIAIIGVAVAGVTLGVNSLGRNKIRRAAVRIASGARFAFHRAVTQGSTVRMAFDLEAGTLGFEEGHGQIVLARDVESEDEDLDEDLSTVDPWAAAQARLDQTIVVNSGRSAFAPITRDDNHPDPRYRSRGLDGVLITRLITPHETEPRESGKGYVHFWSHGEGENAIIQVETNDGDYVYTVEINGLTGASRIFPYAYEPDELEDEALRDPG